MMAKMDLVMKAIYDLASNPNDKTIALKAVSMDGYALMFVNDKLKNDKDVVLRAVSQNGAALSLASPELRGDKNPVYPDLHLREQRVPHESVSDPLW